MKIIQFNSGILKAISLFCITAFIFSFNNKESTLNGWNDSDSIDLLEEGGITNIAWLPDGNEIIVSTTYGEISRYNVRTKTRLWTKVVSKHNQPIYVADVNKSGKEMITYANENSTEAEINLVVRSTNDGSMIKEISEESDYVEKRYEYNDPLDLRKTNNPEDVFWQMMPSSAQYDNNGRLLCVWKNCMETYAMFDHSFVAYDSKYNKIMEWQHVSLNNKGSRNGNMAGFPRPVFRSLNANNYIYGDADCDLYLLDQATIQAGIKNFEIEDKPTGPKFFSRPFEEDIAVTGIEIRGNRVHVTIAGSGYAHYRIYDGNTRKPISPNWLELGNEDYFMSVSSLGTYMTVGRTGFRIYNTSSFLMEYDSGFFGGNCFTFNPVNDNELAVIKSGDLVLMQRN